MIANPILRVLRFTSETCGACAGQKKLQIVERFVAGLDRPSSVRVVELVCQDKDNNAPAGTPYREAYLLSDKYKVGRFPTLVIEAKLEGGGAVELFRTEGQVTLPQLKKIYAESTAEIVKTELAWSGT